MTVVMGSGGAVALLLFVVPLAIWTLSCVQRGVTVEVERSRRIVEALARDVENRIAWQHSLVVNTLSDQSQKEWVIPRLRDANLDQFPQKPDVFQQRLACPTSMRRPRSRHSTIRLIHSNTGYERSWRSPALRVLRRSFRNFVLDTVNRDELAEWETPASGRSWNDARVPVIAVGSSMLAVTALMLAPVVEDTVGVLGIVAGVIGALTGALTPVVAGFRRFFTWVGLGGSGTTPSS